MINTYGIPPAFGSIASRSPSGLELPQTFLCSYTYNMLNELMVSFWRHTVFKLRAKKQFEVGDWGS
jgi:hypothetical protein